MTKYCPYCDSHKKLEDFRVHTRSSDGRGYTCIDCLNSRNRAKYVNDSEYRNKVIARASDYKKDRRLKDPEWADMVRLDARNYSRLRYSSPEKRTRDKDTRQRYLASGRHLESRYGITLDDYNALLAKQEYKCALCASVFGKGGAAIDHCHATKRIRGILCKSCNTGLGLLGDSIEGLRKALNYVEENS